MQKNRFVVIIIACAWITLQAGTAKELPLINVTRPTVIAFFPAVSEADLRKDPNTNEALSDFQYYAAIAGPKLRDIGVEFHELYASSFRVRIGRKTSLFRPKMGEVGYYFVTSGKQPRIEYGVMTDADLVTVSKEYFDTQLKSTKP